MQRSSLFDGRSMACNRRIDEDGLRMRRSKHRSLCRKEQALSQMVFRSIVLSKPGIRLGYAHKLDIGVRRKIAKKSPHMIMLQSNNGNSNRTGRLS